MSCTGGRVLFAEKLDQSHGESGSDRKEQSLSYAVCAGAEKVSGSCMRVCGCAGHERADVKGVPEKPGSAL